MQIQWPPLSGSKTVTILVEGTTDKIIVEIIVERLRFPGRAIVKVCNGVVGVREELRSLSSSATQAEVASDGVPTVIALIDADELSVQDAREHAKKRLGNPSFPVFCAVPTIESWLFADPRLIQSIVHEEKDRRTIARVIAPDTLPNPKRLAQLIFGHARAASPWFFRRVDLSRAIAHSASLGDFVDGLVRLLGGQEDVRAPAVGTQLSRTVFSNLLRELPADTIGWRTVNGEYSAGELADLVLLGDHAGFQYVTELLRLARDILAARGMDEAK